MARKRTIAGLAGFAGLMALIPWSAQADQVILDDLIVDGSACIGQDCVNGESFGFDTIRIKENNLRIKAEDTSNTASFPSNDWQLTFNESSNGGANKFSVDDISGSRTPFTIEAGAPNHSLYTDDGGRIGLGTSTPVVELHIKDGDTPTARFEQDGTSGFTAQTFDVAANETNFFIRDVTNGSKLPFRIRPDAPTSSIDVAADGDIGFGTTSPATELHVVRSDSDANGTDLRLSNGAEYWQLGTTGTDDFLIEDEGGARLRMNSDGLFRLSPVAAPPSSILPQNGDLYVDSANNGTLCFYTGGNWIVIATNGAVGDNASPVICT